MAKSAPIAIRLTEEEKKLLKFRAEKQGIKFSTYIVQAAVSHEGLTEQKKRQIYFSKSKIHDYIEQIQKYDKIEYVDMIAKEIEELWQLLK